MKDHETATNAPPCNPLAEILPDEPSMEPVWIVMVELALIVLLGVVGVIWSLQ